MWEKYINTLQNCHIILTDKYDEIIRSRNSVGGRYTPNLGYKVAREEVDIPEPLWWHYEILRLNCPLKIKLFTFLRHPQQKKL